MCSGGGRSPSTVNNFSEQVHVCDVKTSVEFDRVSVCRWCTVLQRVPENPAPKEDCIIGLHHGVHHTVLYVRDMISWIRWSNVN